MIIIRIPTPIWLGDTGIYGTAYISREAYPDHTSFDRKSKYYDGKTSIDNPKWYMVDLALDQIWDKPVLLQQLKSKLNDANDAAARETLASMPLLQKGSRLSIQPVTLQQWNYIMQLSESNILQK